MPHKNNNTVGTCETMIYAGFAERICSRSAVALVDAGSNNEHTVCELCAGLSDHSRLTYFAPEKSPEEEVDD